MSIPDNCSACPVFKNSLFKDFDQDLINLLASRKKAYDLSKKDILFHQGSDVEGIFCHLAGLAKVDQKDAQGNILFTRFVLPGDTSGHRSLFIEKKYKGTASVLSDKLSACFISNTDMLNLLAQNHSLAKNLIIKISNELNRSENDAISVKERNVRSRLAHLLYTLGTEYGDEIEDSKRAIKSEITKKDIASVLMIASETVIRLMSEFKNEGLISYVEKRIVINDINKMKKLSRITSDK